MVGAVRVDGAIVGKLVVVVNVFRGDGGKTAEDRLAFELIAGSRKAAEGRGSFGLLSGSSSGGWSRVEGCDASVLGAGSFSVG